MLRKNNQFMDHKRKCYILHSFIWGLVRSNSFKNKGGSRPPFTHVAITYNRYLGSFIDHCSISYCVLKHQNFVAVT